MSAGLDQRVKQGQSNPVANGNKDGIKDGFESYVQAPHQAAGVYNTAPMSSPNVTDHYMSSYYPSVSFPYLSQGIGGEGTWSNGDPMSFLGGYGQMNNEYMSNSGMFGFSYGQPGFAGWDFPGSDYTSFTWGTSAPAGPGRKSDGRGYDDAYCHPDNMRPMDGYAMNGTMEGDMKVMEQGLNNMNITNEQYQEQEPVVSVKENVKPIVNDTAPAPAGPKKMSWANVASQPAKPQPQIKAKTIPRAPVLPSYKQNMDIGTWETKNNMATKQVTAQARQTAGGWSGSSRRGGGGGGQGGSQGGQPGGYSGSVSNSSSNTNAAQASNKSSPDSSNNGVLEKLRSVNQYNPREFNLNPKNCRFFIIKSYSEDDIHRSIKYSIWCSTDHGNKRLDKAFQENDGKGPVYLLYSVNGSGHFCGMAQMLTAVDYNNDSSVWAQDKWKGRFQVKWIYVKDVPNSQLRHIRLENNENKPVTNSRDTQEVPLEKGKQVLKIMHTFRHTTSIFDDFTHYEKRQEEEGRKEDEGSPRDNRGSERNERTDRNDRNNDRNDRNERNDRNDRAGGNEQRGSEARGGGRRGNQRDRD